MHQRRPKHLDHLGQLSLALVCAGALLATAAPASAFHSEKERIVEDTAHALRDGEFRLGVWKLGYGLFEGLTIETYTIPWALTAANLYGKYEYKVNEKWSLGPRVGVFRLDLGKLGGDEAEPVVLGLGTVEGAASYRWTDSISVTAGGVYTRVFGSGGAGQDVGGASGAAAVSNFQIFGNFEWRLSDVTALYVTVRSLVFQDATASGSGKFTTPDGYTEVELHFAGEAEAIDFENAASIIPGFVFSWESFNLRLGLSVGKYNIPGINFVVPAVAYVPEADLFWRW